MSNERPARVDDDDDPDEEPMSEQPMSEQRVALVKALYDACDSGDGKAGDGIHIQRLSAAAVSYGPVTEFPLSDLMEMDTSNDGILKEDEMMRYFQVTGRFMSDAEFTEVVSALCESIGPNANADLIKNLCGLAAQPEPAKQDVAVEEEEDKVESTMSDERMARVKALYDACDAADGKVGDGIHIKRLGKVGVTVGPANEHPFSVLSIMDASKDGVVDLDEMVAYFETANSRLSDDEFNEVVDSLLESLKQAQAAEAAEAQ